jgi:hypothetical protein
MFNSHSSFNKGLPSSIFLRKNTKPKPEKTYGSQISSAQCRGIIWSGCRNHYPVDLRSTEQGLSRSETPGRKNYWSRANIHQAHVLLGNIDL